MNEGRGTRNKGGGEGRGKGGIAERVRIYRARGKRAGERDRDAAREQREVFQSRDGSRPGQSIELSLRQAQHGGRR